MSARGPDNNKNKYGFSPVVSPFWIPKWTPTWSPEHLRSTCFSLSEPTSEKDRSQTSFGMPFSWFLAILDHFFVILGECLPLFSSKYQSKKTQNAKKYKNDKNKRTCHKEPTNQNRQTQGPATTTEEGGGGASPQASSHIYIYIYIYIYICLTKWLGIVKTHENPSERMLFVSFLKNTK